MGPKTKAIIASSMALALLAGCERKPLPVEKDIESGLFASSVHVHGHVLKQHRAKQELAHLRRRQT